MVTCPFCCLHCDDLRVDLRGGQLTGLFPACDKAAAGYTRSLASTSFDTGPALRILSQNVDKNPGTLVVLSEDVDQSAAEAAVQLVQIISGTLIRGEDRSIGELLPAMAKAGVLMRSLGGRDEGAETIVLCGTAPVENMPRILDYLHRDEPTINLVDPGIDPIYTLRWLRLALQKQPAVIPEPFLSRSRALSESGEGTFIIDLEWLSAWHNLALELLLFMRELNQISRWYALFHSGSANQAGITEVLSGSAGGTRCVCSIDGQMHPDSQALTLESAAASASVILFAGGIPRFWGANPSAWNRKSAFCLSPCPPEHESATWIPVTQPGVDSAGSMLRMDGVPIGLETLTTGNRLSLFQALKMVCREVA